MPSFKTLLKLGRVSNLPTVWSNVMLVVALYTPNLEAQTLLLMLFFCFAGSFAYIGGMFLNDAFDADYDRQHQPFRPIPAGEISRAAVFSIGFLLLLLSFVCFCLVQLDMTFDFTGTGSSFFINFRPYFLIVSAGLYGSIVLYDWIHKKFAFSVLFMAAARSFLILTVATTIVNIMFIPGLIAAAVHFVYVCSLTIVARL
ncbi:MAG: UbiA family prenyltransferase, partial [Bdellovibrionales bacterium]|nr:UbiA family prenyltransferase [Bdellovibrionales bacterium]